VCFGNWLQIIYDGGRKEVQGMKYCNQKGKQDKAARCGTYSACQICQYRYFYLGIMRETFGDQLILAQDEQEWFNNVYSQLSEEDLRYVKAKYEPETPTAYRKKEV